MQKSIAVRNAQNDAIESAIGASAVLKIRSGAAPASCAAADTGTVVATMLLPADWMANSAGGVKGLQGTWQDSAADAANAGGACHWRIYASDGVTCHLQGTVSVNGGGGELQLDNLNIAAGQQVTVGSFNITASGA
ncbi:hypothetical protein HMF7854_04420 [Sphingomonas ginkgonis]|uniref:Uncharacterized protein n=1 Tax=Sphingomonas ginkgonis TaxID=2315330 RepID=A0A3R9YKZ2_9SPHN|nr:hypothetical protein [Sphingomonas ginkgonis]RST30153.1 hypothetical protein HMF7854_04420 [Sphingomonas ginkgonis]